jgi:hypothetical protein
MKKSGKNLLKEKTAFRPILQISKGILFFSTRMDFLVENFLKWTHNLIIDDSLP